MFLSPISSFNQSGQISKTNKANALSNNQISFNGYLKREKAATKDEVLKTYDTQIDTFTRSINQRRDFAAALDDLMYKDSDIREKIQQLPEGVGISIEGRCAIDDCENSDYQEEITMDVSDPMLMVTGSDREADLRKQKLNCIFINYNEKGPDKDQITAWLDSLNDYFNQ